MDAIYLMWTLGISTNRTVYTFVGSPEAVVEGALNGARASAHYIDMTKHRGTLDILCVGLWVNSDTRTVWLTIKTF